MSELSPLARLTAMPPPSQSTSHSKSIPAATGASVSAFLTVGALPHSPLESKSPGRSRKLTPSRNEYSSALKSVSYSAVMRSFITLTFCSGCWARCAAS